MCVPTPSSSQDKMLLDFVWVRLCSHRFGGLRSALPFKAVIETPLLMVSRTFLIRSCKQDRTLLDFAWARCGSRSLIQRSTCSLADALRATQWTLDESHRLSLGKVPHIRGRHAEHFMWFLRQQKTAGFGQSGLQAQTSRGQRVHEADGCWIWCTRLRHALGQLC